MDSSNRLRDIIPPFFYDEFSGDFLDQSVGEVIAQLKDPDSSPFQNDLIKLDTRVLSDMTRVVINPCGAEWCPPGQPLRIQNIMETL